MITSPTPALRVIFYGSDRNGLAERASHAIADLQCVRRDVPAEGAPDAYVIEGTSSLSRGDLNDALTNAIGDGQGQWALTPEVPIKLVAFDVDSTLVNGEVIDMIAAHWGVGDQVAAVTQAAMEGKLDFNQSLRERVGLLAGCPVGVLKDIHDTLPLNPGARELVATLQANGVTTMMVSGGFTAVTDPLAEELGMAACFANTLEVADGKLTGQVIGEIINGEAKRTHVLDMCTTLGIAPTQAAAVGDGANDLLMMHAVAIGIAYNAKPIVQPQATIALNHPSHTLIAPLLGY